MSLTRAPFPTVPRARVLGCGCQSATRSGLATRTTCQRTASDYPPLKAHGKPPTRILGSQSVVAARGARVHVWCRRFPAERAVWDDERIAATARLAPGATARHEFAKSRHGWLQVARGAVDVNGVALAQGDGLAISDERSLSVTSRESAEVLLFDLA